MTGAPLDLSKARQIRMHASAQGLLSDVARRVRSGYHWWLAGEVPVGKILAVAAKLDDQYSTSASSLTRHRRKAAGDASATLFLWPLRNDSAGYTTTFGFLLLATEHLDGEVMYDGRRKPVRMSLYVNRNAVFHLMPKQVTTERKIGRKPGPKSKRQQAEKPPQQEQVRRELGYEFDWRLSAKSYDLMRERFAAAVSNPAALESLRRGYQALPMTSGYRAQFKTILIETKVAWKGATTPAVLDAKRAIKEGTRADPFAISTLPFIRGFPTLYDDPPMTLSAYLDANSKTRRALERRAVQTVQADHADAGA